MVVAMFAATGRTDSHPDQVKTRARIWNTQMTAPMARLRRKSYLLLRQKERKVLIR